MGLFTSATTLGLFHRFFIPAWLPFFRILLPIVVPVLIFLVFLCIV